MKSRPTLTATAILSAGAGLWSLWVVFRALPALPLHWSLQVAVFVATAIVPLALVEGVSWLTVTLGKELQPGDHTTWFGNPGAFLGMLERVLFLGSLVGGYPEFVAVWFLYKGIEGWRVRGERVRSGRLFQLLLINNAVSLAGVGLAWLAWNLIGLPVHHR